MSSNGTAKASDSLQARLQEPRTVDSLNRLLDHLDTITFGVEALEGFISRGEVIADSLADSMGDVKGLSGSKTSELITKAPQYLETGTRLAEAAEAIDIDQLADSGLLGRLTDPRTLKTVNKLLDHLPLMEFLLESLEGFLSRGETIADNLADGVKELRKGDLKIDPAQLALLFEALPKFREAGEKLLESQLIGDRLPELVDAAVGMVESGMLDKDVVGVLGEVGRKSAEAYQEISQQEVKPVGGLFATLRAARDPDVQKTAGFMFAFAKAFAKHLK